MKNKNSRHFEMVRSRNLKFHTRIDPIGPYLRLKLSLMDGNENGLYIPYVTWVKKYQIKLLEIDHIISNSTDHNEEI